jgi:hypothetical protein
MQNSKGNNLVSLFHVMKFRLFMISLLVVEGPPIADTPHPRKNCPPWDELDLSCECLGPTSYKSLQDGLKGEETQSVLSSESSGRNIKRRWITD